MDIVKITVTDFAQNCRILCDRQARAAVVIDPGGEVSRIFSALSELEFDSLAIWLTHAHIDHAGGVVALRRLLAEKGVIDVPLYAHTAEKQLRMMLKFQAEMFGMSGSDWDNCPEPDVCIDEGSTVAVGRYQARVFFTPGHSPGHVSFYFAGNSTANGEGSSPMLFSGDVLFAGSAGRTDLPGGDYSTLIDTLRRVILPLPDNTIVFSGHGPETTIGEERKRNPFMLEAERS
ncbi:MAG: MBL fold metallo-hydrolase [bacterium]|nr:MBL fold metallo-hydrolase [bacterium]